MTDHPADLDQIRQAADELIPRLAERLSRSGLGEIEVRDGALRVRVARTVDAGPAQARHRARRRERERTGSAGEVEHPLALHPRGSLEDPPLEGALARGQLRNRVEQPGQPTEPKGGDEAVLGACHAARGNSGGGKRRP